MPGVPDVYQGTELWDLSLVDPDNRRPVDFAPPGRLLAAARRGLGSRWSTTDGAAKLLVVSRALRLRRDRPGLFTALRAAGRDRAGRRPRGRVRPRRRGDGRRPGCRCGWRATAAGGTRPSRCPAPTLLTGRSYAGETPLADLLADYPVALLAA